MVISVLKENLQALELFVEKYPEKNEAFKYPLTTFPPAVSTLEGKLYKPKVKVLFRNYLIELPNNKVSEINPNPIVIYDTMAIVRSVPSEKSWDSLLQTLVKTFRLQEAEETILAFNNYSVTIKIFP